MHLMAKNYLGNQIRGQEVLICYFFFVLLIFIRSILLVLISKKYSFLSILRLNKANIFFNQ